MDEIRHNGVVSAVSGSSVTVTIISQSACSACHARGGCLASDMKQKEIEVPHPGGQYVLGQHVTVILRESQGFRALLFGYLLPFLILVGTLVVVLEVTGDELLGGLAALGMLVPYYLLLYFFRERIKKSFSFTIDAQQ
ncbi:MAG TPA: SoxR reducing system RseC family protein [Prolixibacteraceae bacterium]|jgi:sigma-E factor negative regulatory protein RseC|nr:SoxR reducing system RseC family protein [Bacteroidales bacterium]HNQ36313.1 SoxR reducing system RseC family protein [Prolixibacteraceae bacterium]HPJ77520.1 SoxR reducing system RseC family protein [Prolixibacteraceae bacterium]HRV88188.1 SoxR reducing system RseC family protein [Prolixibacteraceae bacterium]